MVTGHLEELLGYHSGQTWFQASWASGQGAIQTKEKVTAYTEQHYFPFHNLLELSKKYSKMYTI